MPDVVKRCVASGLSGLLSEHTYEEGLNALAAKDAVRQAGDFGEADPDTFAEALGCNGFYIPENWEESGWAPCFDPAELETGWTTDSWNLDKYQGYWSPEPVVPDTKTGLVNIFDSNTKTMYIQKGSADRSLSNIPDSTGAFATLQFADEETAEMYGGDKAKAMVDSMYYELEEQLWFAARDLNERGIDPDTANGKILHDYLEDARELMYKAQSYANLGNIAEDESEKLSYYSKAMTEYVKGQCYAKMAQTDSATLEKDYGKYEPEIK